MLNSNTIINHSSSNVSFGATSTSNIKRIEMTKAQEKSSEKVRVTSIEPIKDIRIGAN